MLQLIVNELQKIVVLIDESSSWSFLDILPLLEFHGMTEVSHFNISQLLSKCCFFIHINIVFLHQWLNSTSNTSISYVSMILSQSILYQRYKFTEKSWIWFYEDNPYFIHVMFQSCDKTEEISFVNKCVLERDVTPIHMISIFFHVSFML